MRLAAAALIALTMSAAERRVVVPANAPPPVGPYSPGIAVGDYLYVSGQGARDPKSQFAPTFPGQAEQCLQNVKAVVEAGGMRMADIVYAQIYLKDISNYDALNTIWAKWFPTDRPARSVLGVTRMPTETPIEITVVAAKSGIARQRFGKSEVAPHALRSGDRIYLSGVLGRNADSNRIPDDPKKQVELAINHAKNVLKQAKTSFGDTAFLNVYVTDAIDTSMVEKALQPALGNAPRGILKVASLPARANIEITGIFAPKGSDISAVSATTGKTEDILNSIKSELERRGLTMANVVASNVYVDNLDTFAAMNKIYGGYFTAAPPTRTTVQPTPVAPGKQNIVSVIAVK